jgi:CxxC-x17-CxxC domain-containing protein
MEEDSFKDEKDAEEEEETDEEEEPEITVEEDKEEATEEETSEEKTEEKTEEKKVDSFNREMNKAVCADCGKNCEVPFKPTAGRPVYCRDCYRKHMPQRRRY